MNKRRILFVLGATVIFSIAAFLYITNSRFVSTENAYLKADKVVLSAEVAGNIVEKRVEENQSVRRGDVLVRIDKASYVLALRKAEARVAQAQSLIRSLQAAYKTKLEELTLAEDNLVFAQHELTRQINLAKKNFSSASLTDTRQHELDIARHQVAVIRQDVAGILASLSGHADLAITDYPEVQSAIIDLKQAELNLAHTEILAPFDGFVSNVPPIGKHLGQGSPVLTVVAGNDIWVEANFNETELADIRVNQPVVISVDAYPGRKWQGHISSLSPATGAEFSILPPQNATGNWIKVVQRVPVRIDMEQHSGDPVLRAGMSVHVSVDLHSSSS